MNEIDLNNMTIVKAKSLIKHLENNLNLKLEMKELNFIRTQPNSTKIDSERTSGGKREDKFSNYVIKDIKVDEEIEIIQNQIRILEKYITNELKRIDEYDEWEQKVIYMRESKVNWIKIACSTPFSESTCKRIYRRYKKKRDV